MPGQKRTPEARELIFTAAMYGMTLEELNQSLTEKGFRSISNGSYEDVCKNYAPYLLKHKEKLDEWCQHPPRRSDIPKE